MSCTDKDSHARVVIDHRRQWRDCLYVYPVVSRRARGVSIGVNLNHDKRCNFRCVYCQINRRLHRMAMEIDIPRLRGELDRAVGEALSGRLWTEPRFAETPPEFRRVNDVAFSGDGEPTCLPNFDSAVLAAAESLRDHDLLADPAAGGVRLVVITNASHLSEPQVHRALPILREHNGQVWAKIDAGTEQRFLRINRPTGGRTLDQVCEGILSVAIEMPVVLQTLLFREAGRGPDEAELVAYVQRVRDLLDAGGRIELIQLHTIARPPAEANVSFLPEPELRNLARFVRAALPEVPVEVYPGQDVPPQTD